MPIAKIQLPDGRIATLEVPQGSTEQDVMSYVESNPNLFTAQEPKEEGFQEANRRRLGSVIKGVGNVALGLPTGLGNALVGGVQAATDVIAPNSKFASNLAKEVEKRNEAQSKLPITERIGTAIGETLPFATMGTGMGLVKGGALVGGVSSGLGMKEETGLENRLKDTAIGAGIGAVATPVVNYGLGKAIGGTSAIASKIKNLFTKKAPEDKVASMISKNIPEKDIQAGITQLQEGGDNLVGLDIESPAFENMYKTALTKFPDSKQIANEFARGRISEGYKRINKSLDKISLSDSGRQNISRLKDERKAITAPLYEIADEANVAIPQFNYKTIKTTELPATTRFTNQSKTSAVKKDMQTDLESTEQYLKQGKAVARAGDEKGVITEGSKFLQSQKEVGSLTSGTTKGDTITKTQSKIIREGDKIIKEDRQITNLKDLSAKEKQVALSFEKLKENELFGVAENGMKSLGYKTELNTVSDLAKLKIGLDEKIATMKNADLTRRATIFRKEIDDLVGKLNPERKVADEIYSNYSKIIDAGDEGLKFNSLPKAEIELYVKSLNPKQLEAYRASAKEALLESVEKNIKTLGKDKPAEAIFNSDYDKAKIKTLFRDNEDGFNAFKKEIVGEINYNKTLEKYGLTNAQVMSEDNIIPNLAGRLLSAGTGGGTTGLKFELGRIVEKIALRKYGLNKNNAEALVKAMTNKENSIKVLKTAYNKIVDSEQKLIAKKFIEDISPAITASITKDFSLVSDASAEDFTSEKDFKNQLEQTKKQYPSIAGDIDVDKATEKYKKRYSK